MAILEQAAAALDASHAAGLVHRDVKPANVLLEGSPESERVFLTDFGISRTTGGEATVTGTSGLLGSPDYVAPEQAEKGGADARSDVYSLAAILFFTLTGRTPFERKGDMAKLYAHAHAPRPAATEAAPWLPTAIDDVVARGMAIEPGARYADAGQLAAAAASALEGSASPPAATRRPAVAGATPATRRMQRRPLLTLAGAMERPKALNSAPGTSSSRRNTMRLCNSFSESKRLSGRGDIDRMTARDTCFGMSLRTFSIGCTAPIGTRPVSNSYINTPQAY